MSAFPYICYTYLAIDFLPPPQIASQPTTSTKKHTTVKSTYTPKLNFTMRFTSLRHRMQESIWDLKGMKSLQFLKRFIAQRVYIECVKG